MARAQHAAPELLTFLEAARGQDPTFILHVGGLFPVLYHVSSGYDQLVMPAAGGLESSGHFSSILWILNFGLEYRILGL